MSLSENVPTLRSRHTLWKATAGTTRATPGEKLTYYTHVPGTMRYDKKYRYYFIKKTQEILTVCFTNYPVDETIYTERFY